MRKTSYTLNQLKVSQREAEEERAEKNPPWSEQNSEDWPQRLSLQNSLNLIVSDCEIINAQGIVENNRAISQQLVEANSWV